MSRLTRLRAARALLAVLLGTLLLSSCRFDVYELPLPGGANTGANPITVKAEFRDVLDLVPKSTVKVDDVTVGEVTSVQLDGYDALVTMKLRNDVDLPANAIADIRQTSLLGEKFVSLSPPAGGGSGRLSNGDTIPLSSTGRNPEVEEVFGALSLVLNGGGVAQLKTIATELNKALDGREDSARSVLTQLEILTRTLDDNKPQIVAAIDSLNRLAVSAKQQQGSINNALDQLPSALRSLDSQRKDLVRMLQALNRLGDVGVRVIAASKDATIETVRQLQPTLTELAASGDSFVKAFSTFLTFPFVDEVVGRDPQVARNLHMGDYTDLSVELDLDLSGGITGIPTSLPTILPTSLAPTVVLSNVLQCIASGNIGSAACVKVLSNLQSLANLKQECAKPSNANAVVCTIINQIPGLPGLPGLGGAGTGGTGGLLGGLTGALSQGLFRPGMGYVDPKRGPTLRQLTKVYNPALVKLLVPGMVIQ